MQATNNNVKRDDMRSVQRVTLTSAQVNAIKYTVIFVKMGFYNKGHISRIALSLFYSRGTDYTRQ